MYNSYCSVMYCMTIVLHDEFIDCLVQSQLATPSVIQLGFRIRLNICLMNGLISCRNEPDTVIGHNIF
jgi:hypothetical protein